MSNRKYRLLKVLPEAKAGTILTWSEKEKVYTYQSDYDTGQDSYYQSNVVENNPEWFEEVKEPEAPARIGVQFFPYGTDALNGMFVHSVAIGKQITREEAPALERAIEAVVNGDREAKVNIETLNDVVMKQRESLERKERAAFNAARLCHPFVGVKYDTFEDYINDEHKFGVSGEKSNGIPPPKDFVNYDKVMAVTPDGKKYYLTGSVVNAEELQNIIDALSKGYQVTIHNEPL